MVAPKLLAFQSLAGTALAHRVLLRGGTIIGWDEATSSIQVTRDGSLLITDDRITNIYEKGQEPTIAPSNETQVVDVHGGIITPGFVDTHAHRWQTAYRTIGSNTTLWEYFARYGEFASEGLVEPEDVYIGELMGLLESINAGTTTTLDHAHHTWSVDTAKSGLDATIDSGARVFWSYVIHQLQNFTIDDQFANFRALAESDAFDGTTVNLGLAFDGFGGLGEDPALTAQVVEAALKYNVSVFTTHYVGGVWGAFNTPRRLLEAGLLNTSIPVVFSHSVQLNNEDALLLRQTNQYYSTTPESEWHYGMTNPTSHRFLDQGSLGLDTHWTFSIDLLTQARMWLQHVRAVLTGGPQDVGRVPANNPMSVNQAFLLATRNGGLALRRPDLGVIAPGAKADVVVWNGQSRGLLGWSDPVAAVMLHANVGDVQHVLIDGKFRKVDGILTIEGLEQLDRRFLKSAQRLKAVFKNIPYPVGGEFFDASGTGFGYIEQVDVLRGKGNGYGEQFV
ncbi:unnamed protein product [Clonostachys byssicola]|uniref:Amidohydrolase-related domain-containing protein n=1 Tax=Clonostachys byssicola TaxID=160290 RepID=A0A9N9UN15_9HYPO|nr:unnamed protein product [Clonostachys byssicola]